MATGFEGIAVAPYQHGALNRPVTSSLHISQAVHTQAGRGHTDVILDLWTVSSMVMDLYPLAPPRAHGPETLLSSPPTMGIRILRLRACKGLGVFFASKM